MSRSLKKPPFVHYKLMKRVDDAQASNSKAVIKHGRVRPQSLRISLV